MKKLKNSKGTGKDEVTGESIIIKITKLVRFSKCIKVKRREQRVKTAKVLVY